MVSIARYFIRNVFFNHFGCLQGYLVVTSFIQSYNKRFILKGVLKNIYQVLEFPTNYFYILFLLLAIGRIKEIWEKNSIKIN